MKNIAILTGATAIFAALSVPAFAQTEIAAGANATGISAINDEINDVQRDVRDDFARSNDPERFGPNGRQGLFGSMSLGYSGSNGNSDAQDLNIAGRVSYNQGPWAQTVGLLVEYGQDSDGYDSVKKTSAIYDAQYYFNDRFYAFALGRFTVNGLVDGVANSPSSTAADVADELDDFRRDGFLGFGPGYRVINTAETAWRLQAGIGVRYTETGQQYMDGTGSETSTGYIVSSRFYHRFNDTMFVTNDTDYLTSDDAADVLTNQLTLNFAMSNQLSTQLSLTTEYQDDRAIRTDNTVGVAIVYGF